MEKEKETVGDGEEPDLSVDTFRAGLDVFNGPLDLLLYLIKREEVDIFEIPISRITDQYLAALEALKAFDVNLAAEFLVMAATLMDIKSRYLLPETVDEEEEEDPRDELVKQLLQYRKFKKAADELQGLAEKQVLKWPRVPSPFEGEEEALDPGDFLEDVDLWDLVSVYAEVIKQIESRMPQHIVYDDVPVSEYMDEVMEVLESSNGSVEFLEFFRSDRSRGRVVGVFLALLELIRQSEVEIQQSESGADSIVIYENAEP